MNEINTAAIKKAIIFFKLFFAANIINGSGKTKFKIEPTSGIYIVINNMAVKAANRMAPSVNLPAFLTSSPLNDLET